MHYRSVWISDVHLGSRHCNADALLAWLRTMETDQLFLVGDIIDGWALNRSWYWPQSHNNVIQKLLRQARKGTVVTYLPGNHDEFLRSFGSLDLGNIRLCDRTVYRTVNGKRYLVLHGDQFDTVMQRAKWLMHAGSWAYDWLIWLNRLLTKIQRWLGAQPWSLSAWAKRSVKQAMTFISSFEENLAAYARQQGCDGVICGHIHSMNIRDINGIWYLNCGDFCESTTALVETHQGHWFVMKYADDQFLPVLALNCHTGQTQQGHSCTQLYQQNCLGL